MVSPDEAGQGIGQRTAVNPDGICGCLFGITYSKAPNPNKAKSYRMGS